MSDFQPIVDAALSRIGADALQARLPVPKSADELRAVTDDRYLSMMQQRVFRAGLKYELVDNKWPAFEEVFHGFDPRRVRAMSDEQMEALMGDRRLIRHWGKIKSVRHNAAAMCDTIEAHGSFGAWLADWPGERIVALWHELAKRFAQLGGNSGAYFLRMAGKDTFVLTDAVVRALNAWGAYDGTPKGKGDRERVQQVFNAWAAETGRPLCEISMILAQSVD